MKKVQPLFSKVLVRRTEIDNVSKGGIVLAGKPDESMEAQVIAVGADCRFVKGGELVTLAKYANPNKVKHGDSDCEMIDEKDIYGILYDVKVH